MKKNAIYLQYKGRLNIELTIDDEIDLLIDRAWGRTMARDANGQKPVGAGAEIPKILNTGQSLLAESTLQRMAEEAAVAQILDSEIPQQDIDAETIAGLAGISIEAAQRAIPQAKALLRRRDLFDGR